jgi:RNA polymerase sigma factor (sigma-70 family)
VSTGVDAGDLGALVQRAQRGDRRAVEAVLAAVRDDVHRLAVRMTGCPDDALDATQEILVKVLTRLSTFTGEAAFTTWVHRVAVNHLLDRKRSAVERLEHTFGTFADDLHDGLTPVAPNAGPELDLLAREVKHGCTLALLTCLDREARVVYVLGEVFGVSSSEGASICETTEAAYRKRLSRARASVRAFVGEYCGLVAPAVARCHCRKRVPVAVRLGRIDPAVADDAMPADVNDAVAEMEAMYDAAGLLRSVPDAAAPDEVAVMIRTLLDSGRYALIAPPP